MAGVKMNPLMSPANVVPTANGAVASPAWEDLVNQHHEIAHQTLVQTRDAHKAAGYVSAESPGPAQNQAFVSQPRPPDTTSY